MGSPFLALGRVCPLSPQPDPAHTARALARYDAIAHDLHARPSPVLRERLAETHKEVLAASGAASIEQARTMVPPPRPTGARTKPARRASSPRVRIPVSTCRVCGKTFTHGTAHTACRPVACQGCARRVPRSMLRKGQCPACAPRWVPGRSSATGAAAAARRGRTPFEQANRARQNAQRAEAKRLSQTRRTTGCPTCGNHGDHLCGRQWRLADGTIGKRPRGKGSVWTVRGGLPTLGKRSH